MLRSHFKFSTVFFQLRFYYKIIMAILLATTMHLFLNNLISLINLAKKFIIRVCTWPCKNGFHLRIISVLNNKGQLFNNLLLLLSNRYNIVIKMCATKAFINFNTTKSINYFPVAHSYINGIFVIDLSFKKNVQRLKSTKPFTVI